MLPPPLPLPLPLVLLEAVATTLAQRGEGEESPATEVLLPLIALVVAVALSREGGGVPPFEPGANALNPKLEVAVGSLTRSESLPM